MTGARVRPLARRLLLAAGAAVSCAVAAASEMAAVPSPLPAQQQRADSADAAKSRKKAHHRDALAPGDSAGKKPFAPRPLFASDAPLTLGLAADYGALAKQRDTLRSRRFPAVLTWTDEQGAPRRIEVQLATRGHFRLKATTCGFPPLRVIFPKGQTRGTPFAGQRALKLVTHCRSGERTYEQYVLREYLVYKALNALTDRSFRDRLARVTYTEPARPDRAVTAYGFFVESEDELAGRLSGRILTATNARFEDVDQAQMDLVAVFEYFIGNTDWSLAALHNVRVVATDAGAYQPVPYDFDWSGIVRAHYAIPDPRLPIKSVRERLYRGPCRTAKDLAPTFALFHARRDSILALYRNQRDLDPGYVKDVASYVDDFFDTIDDATRWKYAEERQCAESN